eukprot:TRINITY_DN4709_c0_g1_i1.p1 TRINITY_DN4709_c0_g1~~TRINITY_DN4709_c0_g1_i1.p1  ORF type:complete len:319 (-),score=67.50 TRINITY_DN4709_c0_g1_i1:37-993(-)
MDNIEELCPGVTSPAEIVKFLGKSREPILEGALINVHHHLACEPIDGKPHQILITDHHLWHDYIDYFAGSKPNQTKSRVNRNKSFSSRWFKMPPGRKPKSFIIETYPARRKDVERKLAIVRSKVGDKQNPKRIKIGDTYKVFTPPSPSQLLILLAQRNIVSPKAGGISDNNKLSGKKRRRTDGLINDSEEDNEDQDDDEQSHEEESYDSSAEQLSGIRSTPPKKRFKTGAISKAHQLNNEELNFNLKASLPSSSRDSVTMEVSSVLQSLFDSTLLSSCGDQKEKNSEEEVGESPDKSEDEDEDEDQGIFLLNFLRTSA